jgi:hypothetical protein
MILDQPSLRNVELNGTAGTSRENGATALSKTTLRIVTLCIKTPITMTLSINAIKITAISTMTLCKTTITE